MMGYTDGRGWDGMGMGMGWEWEWEWVDGDREREVVGGGVYVCGMGDELVTATAVWPHGKANQGSAYRKGRRGPLPATTIAPAMPAANRNAATVVSPDGQCCASGPVAAPRAVEIGPGPISRGRVGGISVRKATLPSTQGPGQVGFVSGCVGLLYCVYKGESQYIRHLTDKTAPGLATG